MALLWLCREQIIQQTCAYGANNMRYVRGIGWCLKGVVICSCQHTAARVSHFMDFMDYCHGGSGGAVPCGIIALRGVSLTSTVVFSAADGHNPGALFSLYAVSSEMQHKPCAAAPVSCWYLTSSLHVRGLCYTYKVSRVLCGLCLTPVHQHSALSQQPWWYVACHPQRLL